MARSICALLLLAAVAAVAIAAPQYGVGRMDAIEGLSHPHVDAPRVSSEAVVADGIAAGTIDATHESVSLKAAGSIALNAQQGVQISAASQVEVGTSVTGVLRTDAGATNIVARDARFSALATHTMRSAGTFHVDNDEGPVAAFSFLETRVDSVSGTELSSTFGDVTVAATSRITVNGLLVDMDIGDLVDDEAANIQAGRDVTAHLSGELSVDSRGTINVLGERSVQLTSDDAFMTLESGNVLTIASSTSDVDFIAQQDLAIRSILGEISLESDNVINFNAFTVEATSSGDIEFNTEDLTIEARGPLKFITPDEVSFTYTKLDIEGFEGVKVISDQTLTLNNTGTILKGPLVNIDGDFDVAPIVSQSIDFSLSSEINVDVIASNIYVNTLLNNENTMDVEGDDVFFLVGDRQQTGPTSFENGEFGIETNELSISAGTLLLFAGDQMDVESWLTSINAQNTQTIGHSTVDFSSEEAQVLAENLSFNTGVNAEGDTVTEPHLRGAAMVLNGTLGGFRGDRWIDVTVAGGGQFKFVSGDDMRSVTGGIFAEGDANVDFADNDMTVDTNTNATLSAVSEPSVGVNINAINSFDVHDADSLSILGGWVEWTNEPANEDPAMVLFRTANTKMSAGLDVVIATESAFAVSGDGATFNATTGDYYVNSGFTFTNSSGVSEFFTSGDQTVRSAADVRYLSEQVSINGFDVEVIADDKPEDLIEMFADDTMHLLALNGGIQIDGGSLRWNSLTDLSVAAGRDLQYKSRYDLKLATTSGLDDPAVVLVASDLFAVTSGSRFEVDAVDSIEILQAGEPEDVSFAAVDVGRPLFINALENGTLSAGTMFNLTSDNLVMAADNELTFNTEQIDFKASSLIEFLADTGITIESPLATFESTGDIRVLGDMSLTTLNKLEIEACAGDITMRGRGLEVITPKNIYMLQNKTCGEEAESYHIGLEADDGRAEISAAYVWLNSTGPLAIEGGEVSFESTEPVREEGNIDLFSANQVTLNSVGGSSEVDHGAREDRFEAPGEFQRLFWNAANAIQMRAHGRDDNDGFQDFGMLLDTTGDNSILIEVPAGSFVGNSGEGLRIVTAADDTTASEPQDVQIHAQREIYIETLDGTFEMDSAGALDFKTEGLADTGTALHAVVGDILLESHAASIGVSGFRGVDVLSQLGPISFTSGGDMTHRATIVEESLIKYYAPAGNIDVTAAEDISLGAGSDANQGDVQLISLDTFDVISGQTQRYHQNGPSTAIDHDGVELVSVFGDILMSAGDDLQVSASGHATFDAKVKQMLIDVQGDAAFVSDGARVNVVSARSLSLSSPDGGVSISGAGSGGAVSIISDSNQDLRFSAARDILHIARDGAEVYANTGITGTSETGSMKFGSQGNALFHSGGKLVLESTGVRTAPVDGVSVAGEDLSVKVQRDMTIDADFVTVGRVSSVSSASDPFIEINAGGDDTTAGSVLQSNGNVRFASRADRANVEFHGRVVDVDAQNTLTFDSNGPIALWTTSTDDSGELVVDAFQGNMEVNAQQAAEFYGSSEIVLTTNGHMLLETTSRLGENGVYVDSELDFIIEAANVWDFSVDGLTQVELDDMLVRADNLFQLRNVAGLRGSLEFDADMFMLLEATGDMLFETSGDSPIVSLALGEQSPISIAARDVRGGNGATLTINSGESITIQGSDVDMDGRSAVSFSAPSSGAVIAASDQLTVQVNNTLTVSSFKTFTIDGESSFLASAQGTFVMEAANDVELATELPDGDFVVESDADMHIYNFVNPVRSQRGAVRLESDGAAAFSSVTGDTRMYAQEEFEIRHGDGIAFNGAEGLTVLADDPAGGTIYVKAADDALFEARDDIRWAAGDPLNSDLGHMSVLADGVFEWAIGSNAVGEVFSMYAGDAARIRAEDDVNVEARVSVVLSTDGATDVLADDIIVTTLRDRGDLLFDTSGDAGLHAAFGSAMMTAGDPGVTPSKAEEGFFRIETTGDASFSGSAFTASNGITSDIRVAGGSLFEVSASDVLVGALENFEVVAGGRSEASDTGYGILVDSQQTTTLTSTETEMNSGAGAVSLTASEQTVISAAHVEFTASNLMRVSSGFDATPMSPFEEVIGVDIETTADDSSIEITSLRDDVLFEGFDVTMTAVDEINFVGDSEDDNKVRLHSELDALVDADQVDLIAGEHGRVTGSSSVEIFAEDSATITTMQDITLQSTSPTGTVTFETEQRAITLFGFDGITLDAAGSYVDFQEVTNDSSNPGIEPQVLLIPQLRREAKRNSWSNTAGGQNDELLFHELHVPGCLNRQLGVETETGELCVCDRNKWRCVRPA